MTRIGRFVNIPILLMLVFIFNKGKTQNNNVINNRDIKISENTTLFQKTEDLGGKIKWELFVKNNKENKTILINHFVINARIKSMGSFLTSDNAYLDIPDLIEAFEDGDDLYVFLYIERALWLYRYNFDKDEFKFRRIKVLNLLPGSMDNFGLPVFKVSKFLIGDKYYFEFIHSRVIGKIELLTRFDRNGFTLKQLSFPEPVNKIKDDQQLFRTLDLEQNADKVSNEIRKVLMAKNELTAQDEFKYLGNIDISDFHDDENYKFRTTGYNYFFYEINRRRKIIRYNNYNSEWLFSGVKEEPLSN